jgi:hypothetical protein
LTNPKLKQWEQRSPGRTRPDPVLEAHELARTLNVPVGELQNIAVKTKAPFSVSAMTGFWVRRADLPQWHHAVQRWRADR